MWTCSVMRFDNWDSLDSVIVSVQIRLSLLISELCHSSMLLSISNDTAATGIQVTLVSFTRWLILTVNRSRVANILVLPVMNDRTMPTVDISENTVVCEVEN